MSFIPRFLGHKLFLYSLDNRLEKIIADYNTSSFNDPYSQQGVPKEPQQEDNLLLLTFPFYLKSPIITNYFNFFVTVPLVTQYWTIIILSIIKISPRMIDSKTKLKQE